MNPYLFLCVCVLMCVSVPLLTFLVTLAVLAHLSDRDTLVKFGRLNKRCYRLSRDNGLWRARMHLRFPEVAYAFHSRTAYGIAAHTCLFVWQCVRPTRCFIVRFCRSSRAQVRLARKTCRSTGCSVTAAKSYLYAQKTTTLSYALNKHTTQTHNTNTHTHMLRESHKSHAAHSTSLLWIGYSWSTLAPASLRPPLCAITR